MQGALDSVQEPLKLVQTRGHSHEKDRALLCSQERVVSELGSSEQKIRVPQVRGDCFGAPGRKFRV